MLFSECCKAYHKILLNFCWRCAFKGRLSCVVFVCFIESYINLISTVAPGGTHVISLIDEISYMAPPAPLISQYDDINPDQFCNGDNRPANCGQNCMCTHKVDIPLNAVVEIVLVDEGMLK